MHYDLSHLTQDTQNVNGPIQDDEAVFLFGLIRSCAVNRILEIGGLDGYSARNFCAAAPQGMVYTCDVKCVPTVADHHKVITLDVDDLMPEHVDNQPLDLIFMDCHSWNMFRILSSLEKLINRETIFAVHDTNNYYRSLETGIPLDAPWVHKADVPERTFVNHMRGLGYEAFSIRTTAERHSDYFRIRRGLTILQKQELL